MKTMMFLGVHPAGHKVVRSWNEHMSGYFEADPDEKAARDRMFADSLPWRMWPVVLEIPVGYSLDIDQRLPHFGMQGIEGDLCPRLFQALRPIGIEGLERDAEGHILTWPIHSVLNADLEMSEVTRRWVDVGEHQAAHQPDASLHLKALYSA